MLLKNAGRGSLLSFKPHQIKVFKGLRGEYPVCNPPVKEKKEKFKYNQESNVTQWSQMQSRLYLRENRASAGESLF